MTPAEKPRLTDKKFVFVLFVNKVIKLPMPVDRPAASDNKKARVTLLIVSDPFRAHPGS